jgi:hypothetical protein
MNDLSTTELIDLIQKIDNRNIIITLSWCAILIIYCLINIDWSLL